VCLGPVYLVSGGADDQAEFCFRGGSSLLLGQDDDVVGADEGVSGFEE
jgi:hypothetical protein